MGSTTVAVTVPTQISVPSNSGALTVQIAATYDRSSGTAGTLASQTVTLSGSGPQTVPFTLDLAPCLSDAARTGGSSATSCAVRMQFTLLAGGTPVDAQSVGPYTLAGGGTLTVSPALSFTAVASVQVAPTSGTLSGGAARLVLQSGNTLALTARVLDASGNALSGRAVSWFSSSTGVATVDAATGVVTPVSVGSTTITAAVAGQKGALAVNVVLPPQQVTVTAGSGSGSGTVVSTPSTTSSSIACRVVSGVASGTCALTFASDSAVKLTARPDANNTFAGWNAAVCTGGVTDSTCTFTPGAPVNIAAAFAATAPAVTTTLELNTQGAGGGYITSAQAGTSGMAISCHRIGGVRLGATCSAQYTAGTQVTLTAASDTLSTFAGWSGCTSTNGATCVITIGTTSVTPTANFAAASGVYGVSVAPVTATGQGAGSLTITTTVQSAKCDQAQAIQSSGGTCIAPWKPANVPAMITIRAYPATGSRFIKFAGCSNQGKDANGIDDCTVSADAVSAVSATFDP